MAESSGEEISDEEYFIQSCRLGELEEVTTCYEAAIPLTSTDNRQNTGLHMASANGHLPVVEFLLSKVDLKNAQNATGDTPLHWAAVNNHIEIVKLLVEAGADPKIKNEAGRQAFDEAFLYSYEEVCEFLAPLTEMNVEEDFIPPEEEEKEVTTGEQPEETEENKVEEKVESLSIEDVKEEEIPAAELVNS